MPILSDSVIAYMVIKTSWELPVYSTVKVDCGTYELEHVLDDIDLGADVSGISYTGC